MFLIRRAVVQQVKRVGKLVNKPVMYLSGMLFSYYILSNAFKRNKELKQKPPLEPLNLEDKINFKHAIKSITMNAINEAMQILDTTSRIKKSLNVEYRALLSKLISLYKEILVMNTSDISVAKWHLIVDLQREVQTKRENILATMDYMQIMKGYVFDALRLSYYSYNNMGDLKLEFENQVFGIESEWSKDERRAILLEREYRHIQQLCIKNSKEMKIKKYKSLLKSQL